MSARLFKDDVVFMQRLLKASGVYQGRIDGTWAAETESAVCRFEKESDLLKKSLGSFDLRSESHIAGLHLHAQAAARRFMRKLDDAGIAARIISGTRSYAEQNALFRRGRWGNPGPRVTNARGGGSSHNFAVAWDIGIFDRGNYIRAVGPYEKAAELVTDEKLEWGGDWLGFKDRPHFQMSTGLSIREVRERFEAGKPFLL